MKRVESLWLVPLGQEICQIPNLEIHLLEFVTHKLSIAIFKGFVCQFFNISEEYLGREETLLDTSQELFVHRHLTDLNLYVIKRHFQDLTEIY